MITFNWKKKLNSSKLMSLNFTFGNKNLVKILATSSQEKKENKLNTFTSS